MTRNWAHTFSPRWAIVAALALVLPAAPLFSQDGAGNENGNANAGNPALAEGIEIAAPASFRNLALFPLVGTDAGDDADVNYLTLDEGLSAGSVTVSELGGNESSNNRGDQQQQRELLPQEDGQRRNRNNNFDEFTANNAPQQLQAQAAQQAQELPAEPQAQSAEPQAQQAEPQVQEMQNNEPQVAEAPSEADALAELRQLIEAMGEPDQSLRTQSELSLRAHLALIAAQRAAINAELDRLARSPEQRDLTPDIDACQLQLAMLDDLQDRIVAAFGGGAIEPQNFDPRQQMQQRAWPNDVQGQNFSRGASVNELHVKNGSDRPLYLMSGELLLGGQQDRIVAVDTIIPPNSEADVRVFCVEPGRWNGVGRFGSGAAVVHTKLREVAQAQQDQSQVWDEVRKANRVLGTETDSQTYRTNLSNEEIAAQTEAYIAALTESFELGENVVGVAVAVHGEIVVIDRFGTPAIFRALFQKLLKSYVLAAILDAYEQKAADESADPNADVPAPETEAVIEFYQAMKSCEAAQEANPGANMHSLKRDSEGAVGFENFHSDAAEDGAEPSEGKLLHESYYRK